MKQEELYTRDEAKKFMLLTKMGQDLVRKEAQSEQKHQSVKIKSELEQARREEAKSKQELLNQIKHDQKIDILKNKQSKMRRVDTVTKVKGEIQNAK